MKLAIYYDLPYGGAYRTMEEILKILKKRHEVVEFHNPPITTLPLPKRLLQDFESLIFQRFKQKQQAKEIDNQNFDLVFVSHDKHLQSPWILRYLMTPTVFLCQEPTRSYFEKFLDIDPQLPLLNKIYEKINRTVRKQIEVSNSHFAGTIVANSNYSVESIFRAYGIISKPIHLGIDTKQFYPENITKKNQVLIIGNNEPQKALPFAIKTVSLIPKINRPKLIILSPRERDYTEINKLAKKLHVDIDIKIGLNPDAVRREYNESKLTLALAYLEPFGLSVIESLACGTPVVAVDEGGFKETVDNNITGLLLERDEKQIALATAKLLADNKRRDQMGKNGIAQVTKNFSWNNTVNKLENIFNEITENRCYHR